MKRLPTIVLTLLGLALAGVLALTAVLVFAPSIVVKGIQATTYQGAEINPTQAAAETTSHTLDNGIEYVNDIRYTDTFAKGFLDIRYALGADGQTPTIVYFHGGGFFAGDKAIGDPLAVNDDANYLLEQFVLQGYNLVAVNYALTPASYFPGPVLQMNEAINYLITHADELNISMDQVRLFGSSAGAIMVSQYITAISNPTYADLFEFTQEPLLTPDQVHSAIIDDAPIVPENMNIATRVLIGNYLQTSIFLPESDNTRRYNPIPYLTQDTPKSITLAGTNDGFPADMRAFAEALNQAGGEATYFHTDEETYGLTMHGYMGNLKYDTSGASQAAFDRVIEFIR
ncbi:hypothetical protein A7979_11170 [Rothia nasimurium]|uniref:BD-FAE-like domain-containing protein n=1 Tax=Rothia nasimurium TaxID=85336 RepID=A0A1Y1RRA8_9MICC|nr:MULTISPECIES: alpha/beta hydrolase [Rothia]ORC20257.1 hypothetical protein A7979_11170 [Rothia nasimurium]